MRNLEYVTRRDRLKAEPANGRNVTRSKAQKKHERKEKQRIRMRVYRANTIHQKKEAIKKRESTGAKKDLVNVRLAPHDGS